MNTALHSNSFLILNLHHAEDALRAESASKPVYWVSSEHPAKLLGALLGDFAEFEGAWMENFRILVQLKGRVEVFEASGAVIHSPTELAAFVLEQVLEGKPAQEIQSQLQLGSIKESACAL